MNYVKVMGEPPLNYLFFQEPPFRVRAIDTFEQGDVNDLPFNKGDIITIIGLANRYWWRGRLNGKEGFVPRKYVAG
ncbi:hypothetical protein CPB86DRAFT_325775 [Serendipita vermifera]|nr:hypothetical protein CPB86DRAFT_325775 [Serendipita vermifera]